MLVTTRAISLESLDAITDLTMGMQQQKINPTTVNTIGGTWAYRTIPSLFLTIPD